MRRLYHLCRADYLERIRRHGFLVTLGLTVYFSFLTLPPIDSNYATLQIAERRGIYNSAWVGCNVALLASAFLTLLGFYLVKNAVERDRRTGVGEILAATPLTKPQYVLGKWASNLAVLATMLGVLAVCSIGMQRLRGEETTIQVLHILLPFLFLALPAMSLTAGLAVFFEATPGLRGGLGNALYFFVWPFLAVGAGMGMASGGGGGIGDVIGLTTVVPQMQSGMEAAFPGLEIGADEFSLGINIRDERNWITGRFPWAGMVWSMEVLFARLSWFAIGAAVALAGSVPFDRFAGGARVRAQRVRPERKRVSEATRESPRSAAAWASLPPPITGGYAPLRVLGAEFRLALSEMPRLWFLPAAALAVACWLAPLEAARAWLLPFAWIWPLLVWSGSGCREARHGTAPLLFSSPAPLWRQLPASWLVGVGLAALLGAGVGVRLLAAGEMAGVLNWCVGALFGPTLGLAAGAWTGSGKLMEVAYMALWYVGPLQRTPEFDFVGTSAENAARGGWVPFAVGTGLLLVAAALGRRRALRT